MNSVVTKSAGENDRAIGNIGGGAIDDRFGGDVARVSENNVPIAPALDVVIVRNPAALAADINRSVVHQLAGRITQIQCECQRIGAEQQRHGVDDGDVHRLNILADLEAEEQRDGAVVDSDVGGAIFGAHYHRASVKRIAAVHGDGQDAALHVFGAAVGGIREFKAAGA